jgi:hypothetical protein
MTTADSYSDAIRLLEPFVPLPTPDGTTADQSGRDILVWLLAERGLAIDSLPADADQDAVIRNLLTVRRPGGIPATVLACLDQVFASRARSRGAVAREKLVSARGPRAVIA